MVKDCRLAERCKDHSEPLLWAPACAELERRNSLLVREAGLERGDLQFTSSYVCVDIFWGGGEVPVDMVTIVLPVLLSLSLNTQFSLFSNDTISASFPGKQQHTSGIITRNNNTHDYLFKENLVPGQKEIFLLLPFFSGEGSFFSFRFIFPILFNNDSVSL